MHALGLCPAWSPLLTKPRAPTKPLQCARKNHSVPLTSPLGSLLLANTLRATVKDHAESVEQVEKYCRTSDTEHILNRHPKRECTLPKWLVDEVKPSVPPKSCHHYCFNNGQRREKLKSMKRGLSLRSYRLLKKCRRVRIPLERLDIEKGTIVRLEGYRILRPRKQIQR